MDSRIAAAIAEGAGLVTAARLRGIGVDPRVVATLVRQGELVAVRRGVYTTRSTWDAADAFRGRPFMAIRAAELTLKVPHVFSHDSAAVLHRIPLIDVRRSEVHITRRRVLGSRHEHGVRHHGATYDDADVVRVGGLDALTKARTVIDIARTHGYDAGLVAADGALRLGVTPAELEAVLATMASWPGITMARAVMADADAGAESAAETLGRILVKELGLGPVETQFPVVTEKGVRWGDIRVGRHLFEVHGRIKVRSVEDGGVASTTPEAVVWEEKKRERMVVSRGFGVSNIVWQDFWEPHRSLAKARLKAEYVATSQRFGSDLTPELARDAAELRGRRRPPPAAPPPAM